MFIAKICSLPKFVPCQNSFIESGAMVHYFYSWERQRAAPFLIGPDLGFQVWGFDGPGSIIHNVRF
jgi:hypothetical protein